MSNHYLITNYYTQHRDEIVHFVAVRISDADEAQDRVQDIFLHLLAHRQPIMPNTLPSLVYTMARHQIADYFRRRNVCKEYEKHAKNADFIGEIETSLSVRMMMEHMEQSLTRLPEACGRIYRLHIYDGLKVSDIARQLALPYKQVENRLGQARRQVRQQLAPYHHSQAV